MDAINLAISLIEAFEGWSSEPYKDPTGTWTIGYGFTSLEKQAITCKTSPLTQAMALQELKRLLLLLKQRLNVECMEPLTNHQEAACLSLAYNIGMGEFGRSTLLKYLNDGAYGAASAQFSMFTHSKGITLPGLVKRRAAEQACFNTKD